MCRNSASSVRVIEALDEVGACCDWRVFVGAVAAADQSLVVRLDKERQRLTSVGVSRRRQQNSVELRDNTAVTMSGLHAELELNCIFFFTIFL